MNTTTDTAQERAERAATLRLELQAVAVRFVSLAQLLEAPAAELAGLEAQLRAATYRAGDSLRPRPTYRELAADVVRGALQPLRPHVDFISAATAQRAAEQLQGLE